MDLLQLAQNAIRQQAPAHCALPLFELAFGLASVPGGDAGVAAVNKSWGLL